MMKMLLGVLEWTVKAVMLTAVLLWAGDWTVFEVRAARGGGYDQVQVEQYLSTALKGNKTEFDYLGTAQVSCARALFPHGGDPACWWVRRHKTEWE